MNSLTEIAKTFNINFTGYETYEQIIINIFSGNFNEEESIETNDSNIINIVGLYYDYVKEDLENAEKIYRISIGLNNYDAMNNLGNIKRKQENYREMEYWFNLAIEHDNIFALFSLAEYHDKIGNTEKAIELCLNNIEVKYIPSILLLSNIYIKMKEHEKAIDILNI